MHKAPIPALLLMLLTAAPSAAQFVSSGTDGAGLRWRSIESATWKVVYPEGADSLAKEYARALEGWKRAVGGSIGVDPNGNYRRKMPVVLHTGSVVSNGMVTWLPRRMELFTTPESVAPDPYPWTEQLAIHESRHVAQMQFAAGQEWTAFKYLSGELWTGVFSALYGGPAFLEGDAVVAETALSSSGRARTADFLEFMRASDLEGKPRGWWQWCYGSLSKYTPDYYKAGYALVAGMRVAYGDSLFTQRFYDRIQKKWLPYNNLKNTAGAVTGHALGKTWKTIDGNLTGMWKEEADSRAPYTYCKLIGKQPRRFVSYARLTLSPDGVFAVRSGIDEAATLVFLPFEGESGFGREAEICPFSSSVGMMCYSVPAGRLFWSETRPDIRREMKSSSALCFMDGHGRKKTLVRGRMLFNPSASPDEPKIAAVEQFPDGRSRVVVFDAVDGSELSSFAVPAGMQVSETVWAGGRLFASVLTDDGIGLRSLPDFESLVEDSPVKINSLSSDGHDLFFTSDRGGSNEVYAIASAGGRPVQLTSSRVGAKGGIMTPEGLLFTSVSTRGKLVYLTPADSLRREPVDWKVRHKWVWEDRLSAQERAIRKEKGIPEPDLNVELSDPVRYSKGKNLLHFHSWLPVYVSPDGVAAASLETVIQTAWFGATGFFQNLLGTLHGTAGVRLPQLRKNAPFAAGSAQITYEGLFPVIEGRIDIGSTYASNGWKVFQNRSAVLDGYSDVPAFSSNLRAYVPLNLSSGGWKRGAVVSASWNISNDLGGVTWVGAPVEDGEETPTGSISSLVDGRRRLFNRATLSARFYTMRPVASSCVYPRVGIGVEAGYMMFPGMAEVSAPITFFHSYGYLPGLWKNQGLRLSWTTEAQGQGGMVRSMAGNYIPRGFGSLDGLAAFLADHFYRSTWSADYVIPFWSIESDRLCPIAYIRNMEATLHGDYSSFQGILGSGNVSIGGLASAGIDLCLVLGNLAWVPYDTRIGISWNHCWGIPQIHDTFNLVLNVGL